MCGINKEVFKETLVIVFSGLVLNYPLNFVVIWLLVDFFTMTSALAIATISTFIFTVVSIIRVYFVRVKMENKKAAKCKV
jgi:hypothetical protein